MDVYIYTCFAAHLAPVDNEEIRAAFAGRRDDVCVCMDLWIYGSMHAYPHTSAHLAPVDNEEIRAAFVGRRDDICADALDLAVHDPVLAQGLAQTPHAL